MRYEFHPEALEEYRQAALWYAGREPELGLHFIGSVEDAIKRVVEAPTRWRVIEEDVRRCLTHVCGDGFGFGREQGRAYGEYGNVRYDCSPQEMFATRKHCVNSFQRPIPLVRTISSLATARNYRMRKAKSLEIWSKRWQVRTDCVSRSCIVWT